MMHPSGGRPQPAPAALRLLLPLNLKPVPSEVSGLRLCLENECRESEGNQNVCLICVPWLADHGIHLDPGVCMHALCDLFSLACEWLFASHQSNDQLPPCQIPCRGN